MAVFILYPSNVDDVLDDVRLHIGDFTKVKFSDSILRASLLGAVRMLQKRWKSRYLVFNDAMLTSAGDGVVVPSGYVHATVDGASSFIPSGLSPDIDVVRNPNQTFSDPGPEVIAQEDRFPLTIAASLILRKSQLTSSADTFVSWNDGGYSFSNLSAIKPLTDMYNADKTELDAYFKRRPAIVLRDTFQTNYPFGYPIMPLILF